MTSHMLISPHYHSDHRPRRSFDHLVPRQLPPSIESAMVYRGKDERIPP
uniref:ORF C1 n=1 Tax=Banana bunchy top virus TaxID=12585 RepID=Q89472_BBTV|nr:ORF C1 [Banana bunchy top virus]AAA61878.1 ORF C1 [Banana bunchy top virus]